MKGPNADMMVFGSFFYRENSAMPADRRSGSAGGAQEEIKTCQKKRCGGWAGS